MLPGKKYKPEDFLWVAWTRKWVIIIPTLVISLGVFTWSWFQPDLYKSSTSILVIPQRVPESYVQSTVTASVAERLGSISQQILSRTRLERLIEEFNLYPEERKTMIMEDIVNMMRDRDINLEVENPRGRRNDDASHFSVSYDSPNPRTAMQVADRLANMFVNENMQDRASLADSTSQFLQSQLEDAKRRLQESEKRVETFKLLNTGQLPNQQQTNMQMLQVTQTQIQSNEDAIARERDQLSVLESVISESTVGVDQPLGGGVVESAPSGDNKNKVVTVAQLLSEKRAELRGLEARYLPDHPDVKRTKREVGELERRAADEATRVAAAGGAGASGASNRSAPAAAKLTQQRMEAERLRKSLDTRRENAQRLQTQLAAYKARIEVAPKLESELTELTRDYDTLEKQYLDLLRKSEESKIAVNLERRQVGEQFKVIDTARLPERPSRPNRLRINAMGLLAGLGLGLALVALLEYRDTRLKTDDDVVTSLALPVLAVIPRMITTTERRQTRRRRLLLAVSTSLVLVLAGAAIAWRLQWLQAWVR